MIDFRAFSTGLSCQFGVLSLSYAVTLEKMFQNSSKLEFYQLSDCYQNTRSIFQHSFENGCNG